MAAVDPAIVAHLSVMSWALRENIRALPLRRCSCPRQPSSLISYCHCAPAGTLACCVGCIGSMKSGKGDWITPDSVRTINLRKACRGGALAIARQKLAQGGHDSFSFLQRFEAVHAFRWQDSRWPQRLDRLANHPQPRPRVRVSLSKITGPRFCRHDAPTQTPTRRT